MPADRDKAAAQTLGDEEITVLYRNSEDLVRRAVSDANGLREQVSAAGPDDRIALPVTTFRNIVAALRLTYKTLGETLHQIPAGRKDPGAGAGKDAGRGKPARTAAENPEVEELFARFDANRARAREALNQAAMYSDGNEDAARSGDQIEVPAKSLEAINEVLVESNEMMVSVLARARFIDTMAPASGDRGDKGVGANWYNSGNWYNW